MPHQPHLTLTTRPRSTLDITADVTAALPASGIRAGLVNVFVQHTSCSLLITENADPDVRRDLETVFARLAPDGDPAYRHDLEGDDDMAAHARSVLQAVRDEHEDAINDKLNHQLSALETLKQRHIGQLELDLGSALEAVKQKRKEERLAQIDSVFTDYLNWLENTQCTEPHPYLQVVAVFTGVPA